MAKNKGEYQKKKERKEKFSAIVSISFFLVGILLFSYLAVHSVVNVQDIDRNRLNSYVGDYEYRVKEHRRGTGATYIFTLSNGHEVHVSMRDVRNADQIKEHKHLILRYSTTYSNPLYRFYGAVSITSMDGTVEFVNSQDARRQSVASGWLASIFALICLLFEALLIVICYGPKWKAWYRRRRKQIQNKWNHYESDT